MKTTIRTHATTESGKTCHVAGAYTVYVRTRTIFNKTFIHFYGISDRGFPLPAGYEKQRVVVTGAADLDTAVSVVVGNALVVHDPCQHFRNRATRHGCRDCPHCIPEPITVEGDDVSFTASCSTCGVWQGHAHITCANQPKAAKEKLEWDFDFILNPYLDEPRDFRLKNISLPHPHSFADGVCVDYEILSMVRELFDNGEPKAAIGVLLSAIRHIEPNHWHYAPDLLKHLEAFQCYACGEIDSLSSKAVCANCSMSVCSNCANVYNGITFCNYCNPLDPLDPNAYTFTKDGVPKDEYTDHGSLCVDDVVRLDACISTVQHTQAYVGIVTTVTRLDNMYDYDSRRHYCVRIRADKGRYRWPVTNISRGIPIVSEESPA